MIVAACTQALGTQTDAALDVLMFWRASQPDWFSQSPAFDKRFRDRFSGLHESAARREHDGWADSAEGSLALLILLDQFPRNAFRGSARMYATDGLARHFARIALVAGHMDAVETELKLFFCLPFAHSEHMHDQYLSVQLNARLGQPWLGHAQDHRDIIRRFGRFPHRNPLLGRQTTSEERRFLDDGGFAG